MKKLFLAMIMILTANIAQAHDFSGVRTTADWISIDNPYNVSGEDTPTKLGEAGERFGEFLKDANEDIGEAAQKGADFINKL